ncbi:MAG: hypothetical protein Q4C45_06810 [Oscillospiraceae bacterium]|nr:hypothetical protein [Oscillospiraceae bacterium]
MNRFRDDGHLTDEALSALARGDELDELGRLEAAEHLAFCDLCLQRYTDLLDGAALLTPERSCRESLWRRIRQRTVRLLTSRYATAATAVALALTVVWGSGRIEFVRAPALPEDRPSVSQGLREWTAKWSDSLDGAMSGLNDFFDGLGRTQPARGGTN